MRIHSPLGRSSSVITLSGLTAVHTPAPALWFIVLVSVCIGCQPSTSSDPAGHVTAIDVENGDRAERQTSMAKGGTSGELAEVTETAAQQPTEPQRSDDPVGGSGESALSKDGGADVGEVQAPGGPEKAEEEKKMTGQTVAGNAGSEVRPGPVRPPIRRAGRGDIVDITFDDLKLDMPVGTLFKPEILTPRVRELDGRKVRLRGFIFAGGVFQTTGIASFPFVMNTQCKFGPQGLAYCVILVELDKGVTTDFTTYPVTVEGTLTVRPLNMDGFTWSVYHMQGTKVY